MAIEKKDFKRHKDVVAYFNRMYVATGKFPRELGRVIAEMQQLREKSDCDDFFMVSIKKEEQQVLYAEEVITEVEHYLERLYFIERAGTGEFRTEWGETALMDMLALKSDFYR